MISKSLKSALLKKKIQPNEVGVFLGPHIRAANYEIKDDISRVLRGSKWEKFIKEVGSKYFFDLTAGVICEFYFGYIFFGQATEAGLSHKNFFNGSL